jgi:hypothetical protein
MAFDRQHLFLIPTFMKTDVSAIQIVAHFSHGLDILHMRRVRYIAREKTTSACDEVVVVDGDENERRLVIPVVCSCF